MGTSLGAPVVLVPAPDAPQPLLSDSPLVQNGSPGPDGVPDTGDETRLGFAYAVTTLSEPGDFLAAAAALATLAGVGALRRRPMARRREPASTGLRSLARKQTHRA